VRDAGILIIVIPGKSSAAGDVSRNGQAGIDSQRWLLAHYARSATFACRQLVLIRRRLHPIRCANVTWLAAHGASRLLPRDSSK